jgi:cytochrome b561
LIAFRDANPIGGARMSVHRAALCCVAAKPAHWLLRYDDGKREIMMQWRNSAERFGVTAQTLHWLTAVCMLAAWLGGTFDDAFGRGGETQAQILALHWSFGLLVLAFACARAAWRAVDRPPAAVAGVAAWEHHGATLGHMLLYAVMLGLPVTGLFTAFAQDRVLSVFGLFVIPPLIGADRALARSIKDIHSLLGNVMLVLVGLHVLAALRHHFILRNPVLRRMLPLRSTPAGEMAPPSPRR